jgi:hypothetical protein
VVVGISVFSFCHGKPLIFDVASPLIHLAWFPSSLFDLQFHAQSRRFSDNSEPNVRRISSSRI